MLNSDPLEQLVSPLYSYADADYLAALSRGTAPRWLSAYRDRDNENETAATSISLLTSNGGWQAMGGVSFVQLVELVAVGGLRQIGFTFPQIRRIVASCRTLFQSPYPLAMEQFKKAGREIFIDQGRIPVELIRQKGAQAWETVLRPFLNTLEYDHAIVRRWWPRGINESIVIDPSYSFGLPSVKGSGVRTEIILERFQAGDLKRPIEQIAEEFNITETDVNQALRFEISRLEKARLAA